jgi:hypothetical protein
MPVVCDFNVISGTTGTGVTIDEVVTPAGARCPDDPSAFCATFGTGGRHDSLAMLMMQVSGLTFATDTPTVFINGNFVGSIQPVRFRLQADRTENDDHWYTQYIVFDGGHLNSGTPNLLRINGVTFPEATASNQKDRFRVRDVVCWFHQSA